MHRVLMLTLVASVVAKTGTRHGAWLEGDRRVARGGASSLESSSSSAPSAWEVKQSADAAQRSGELVRARSLYAVALSALAEMEEDDGSALAVASCQLNLARCCSKLGEDRRAIECCNAALASLESCAAKAESRPLRGVALYRRAIAKAALGDTKAAADDANRALALGENRAASVLQKVGLTRAAVQPRLDDLLAEPERIAKLVPLAKAFATPEVLETMGLDAERSRSLSKLVSRLEPDTVQIWFRRARLAYRTWNRLARATALVSRLLPYAVYASFLTCMAYDSLYLFA